MFDPKPKTKLDVNLVPLVNIVFLLLIFFLLTGTIAAQDPIEVALPEAEMGDERFGQRVKIFVNAQNAIYLHEAVISLAELQIELRRMIANNGPVPISINADGAASARGLLLLLQHVEEAGGQQVAIATEAR